MALDGVGVGNRLFCMKSSVDMGIHDLTAEVISW
jgi:hypothetical protein